MTINFGLPGRFGYNWTAGLRAIERGDGQGAIGGIWWGERGWGPKYVFPHPYELLIWVFSENLVKSSLMV